MSGSATSSLPMRWANEWITTGVEDETWTPCTNHTIQWQGGASPYALQPIVTYDNGTSIMGSTRTNILGLADTYLADVEVGTAVSFVLTDSTGDRINTFDLPARIIQSGLGANFDRRCLNFNQAVFQNQITTSLTFRAATISRTTTNYAPTSATDAIATAQESSPVSGKSSTALGILLALAILIASLFAFLFFRTKRQYVALAVKLEERYRIEEDLEKLGPPGATSPSRKATLHRLSTTEARHAVYFGSANGISPTSPLSGTTAVSGSRQVALGPLYHEATPVAASAQNPFASNDDTSLQTSPRHRFSSISGVTISDRPTSILSFAASALEPSEVTDRAASVSRQSLYSEAATETTAISNPVSDAHYHRTQARTIRRLL